MAIETPLPTKTLTPTATQTKTPTPSPTVEPTPTILTSESLQKDASGKWVYSDQDAGYKFVLGGNWYLEDVSSLKTQEIIDRSSEITREQEIESVPVYLMEQEGMRLVGVYLDETIPDYLSVGFNTFCLFSEGFVAMSLTDAAVRLLSVLAKEHNLGPEDFSADEFTNQKGVAIILLEYPTVLIFIN